MYVHLWVIKLNLFIFTHAPKQNFPPGFYHYPQAEGNYLKICENLFFPISKGKDYGVKKIRGIRGIGHKLW